MPHPLYDLPSRALKRRTLWLELIEAFQLSGMSYKAFSKKHDVKIADLKRWFYRYKSNRIPGIKDKPLSAHLGFTEVEISGSTVTENQPLTPTSHLSITLQHRCGIHIQLDGNVKEGMICQCIRALGELSC